MFSVSINEKKKKNKTVKGPQKAHGCSITHTPTRKRAPAKEQRGQEKPGVGQVQMGAVSPVQYALRVREEKAPFCQKRSGKKWEDRKG